MEFRDMVEEERIRCGFKDYANVIPFFTSSYDVISKGSLKNNKGAILGDE
jgi:hypothetical protein